MGAAALCRMGRGAHYLEPVPVELTASEDATKLEIVEAEHHEPPALKRPSLLKSFSALFENTTNPVSPTTESHGYLDLLQQRFYKNLEDPYIQNQELRDKFYEFLENELTKEDENIIKLKVKSFKTSNRSSNTSVIEQVIAGVVAEGSALPSATTAISPHENEEIKDIKSVIHHHRDGSMMEITMKEFYQQLMFHFLFQFESSSTTLSPNSPSKPAIFPSTPNNTELFIETPFETLFCDYQIDLSDHAHRKASLLTLVKNREVLPQRAYSHADLDGNLAATVEEILLNNEVSLIQIWQNPYLTVEQCIDFLFLFFFSIFQEIYKNSYYELIVPSTLPHTSSFTLRIVKRLSKEMKAFYEAPDEDDDDSSHTRGLYSSSYKKFLALEQQTSDQIHFKRYQGLNQLYDHVHSHVNKNAVEFMDYGSSGKWCETSNFLATLDELGVALMIATVEKDGHNCPLIHVNSAFERLTQYNRHEVLGRSCSSLLEGGKTEKGQKEKIRKALESGRALKVGIMHHKKDGSSFLNLLSLLPIYDRNGEYRYVVGKLEDVSSHMTTMKSVEYGEDVMYWVGLVFRSF